MPEQGAELLAGDLARAGIAGQTAGDRSAGAVGVATPAQPGADVPGPERRRLSAGTTIAPGSAR